MLEAYKYTALSINAFYLHLQANCYTPSDKKCKQPAQFSGYISKQEVMCSGLISSTASHSWKTAK